MAYKRFTKSDEQLRPDPRYNSKLVSKFINCLMYDGKKSVATRLFYDAMDIIAKKVKDVPPIEVFEQAIQNVKPNIEVRSKRVGGSNYQVPIQVNRRRQQSLAIRWILEATRSRKGQSTSASIAQELIDAFNRQGSAMTTRENVHKMADANKAFSHFAW
ncbi:MAG TPA: 30S ribosomal protein S7 [Phycisphaerae bacterium]|jgi:small subunit ribosomal protein S7|nr:30S ribosomal protein S7 [Phycisphaerae bacterium]HOJ55258.1 30S ribosomal protein S7 [Phycisphaerae bacterium]HOL27887.1 30S ribosomal protein S7 [Phycisphaerae bacterium]HPP22336.1 30S ribosomal protein S7 [Phycisphaerae bacterium]HPU34467.1 30S ribosomal protein S7 [Phycisphaerae bacterium]